MIFALSVALAYVLTNIDGLFAFLALSSAGGSRRVLPGFLATHIAVICGSFLVGAGATFLPHQLLGYLGIVPIALGIWEIWKTKRRLALDETENQSANSFIGASSIFLALSADTFVLLAAIFADSRKEMDHFAVLGAVAAVTFLLILGSLLSSGLAKNMKTGRFFERLSPFVMIVAGVYILLDTTTDVF